MPPKQVVGGAPYPIYIDPYPASYPQQTTPNAAGLGGPGALYARTSAGRIDCGTGYPNYIGSTLTTLIFVMGNGTEIDLVDSATNGAVYTVPNACGSQPNNWNAGRGAAFESIDGTMVRFTSDSTVLDWNPNAVSPGTAGHGTALISGELVFPNGLTYRIDSSHVSWIRDRNGNKITLSYTNGPTFWVDWYLWVNAPTQIVDSLNRTAPSR